MVVGLHPQQLANKVVGVPYFAGTHYLALLMLEGFVPRDMIKTCLAANSSRARLASIMKGEIDATTLTEPYITVAEKAGCRVMVMAPSTAPRWPLRALMPRPTPPSAEPYAPRYST